MASSSVSTVNKPPTPGGSSSPPQRLNELQRVVRSTAMSFNQLMVVDLMFKVLKHDISGARTCASKLVDASVDETMQTLDSVVKLAGPLHLAAETGSDEMCAMLILECGCDTNATCLEGTTPLISAIKGVGGLKVVKFLIGHGADLNKGDNLGITPMHIAATKGDCEIGHYLLSNGAEVDPICEIGESPLHVAACKGHEGMVTMLLRHKADPKRFSCKHHTPLLASLFGSSLRCLELLVKAGADVNTAGSLGTPLMVAASKGLDECLEYLLKSGADANAINEDCDAAIDIAASKGFDKCVEILAPCTKHLSRYGGMSSSEIVQKAAADRLQKGTKASEEGDAYYWKEQYDVALACYALALNYGHSDVQLHAKRSLCYLCLGDEEKFGEAALIYMSMVLTDVPSSASKDFASELVMEYSRKWRPPRKVFKRRFVEKISLRSLIPLPPSNLSASTICSFTLQGTTRIRHASVDLKTGRRHT